MSQKLSGTYVGLLNGVSREEKSQAKRTLDTRGMAAAVAFLRRARQAKKTKKAKSKKGRKR